MIRLLKEKKFVILIVLVAIGCVALLTVLNWPESSSQEVELPNDRAIRQDEAELPNGRSLRVDMPLSGQVDDLNGDGERDILDLILEINER